jgi:hypothetical protein
MNGLLVELGHVVTASMLSLTIHMKGLLGELRHEWFTG